MNGGHYQLEDAMLYIALGDVAVLEYSGEQFGEILNENHDISTQLIDWYVAYSNLLLFDAAHQKFNDAFKKLCNLLYLLVANENDFQKLIGGITQNMLAEILGVSQGTVTNGLARLREEEIIKTERKQIVIRDIAALAGYCSYEIL